jgi:hypothetical protein
MSFENMQVGMDCRKKNLRNTGTFFRVVSIRYVGIPDKGQRKADFRDFLRVARHPPEVESEPTNFPKIRRSRENLIAAQPTDANDNVLINHYLGWQADRQKELNQSFIRAVCA